MPQVVVVGGGPGGLATAISLAQRGVPVTVLEKKNWPVDKVCGEGVMPSGRRILEQLGVMAYLRPCDCFAFKGIRYIDESGLVAEGHFTAGAGAGIRRTVLSHALHQTAAAYDNIMLLPEHALRSLRREGRWICMEVDGQMTHLRASLVIGADGLRSTVRRLAGLERVRPVRQQRWGARRHFNIEPWSDCVEVYWSRGVEAYVTPLKEHTVQVAFLWDRDILVPAFKGRKLARGLLQGFPTLADRIAHAEPLGDLAALGPMACQAKRVWTDRIILIGDALGFVDGITGEGISATLQQAAVLGKCLPGLLRDDRLDATGLAALAARLRRIYHRRFMMARPALFLTRHPDIRKMAIRGLARVPGVFRRLLDFSMGDAGS